MNMTETKTVNDLLPRLWLKPEDLGGRRVTVKIIAAQVQEFRQRDGTMRAAVVLSFERAQRRLIANKTQCLALAEITGKDAFADWPGHSITLGPATAPNGKPTIAVAAAE